MKLRNKKTGVIIEPSRVAVIKKIEQTGTAASFNRIAANYYSLAELNEEWEDAPAEPLIKDENVRALVRNWLMINKVDGAFRHNSNALRDDFGSLLIVRGGHFENLKSEAFYTKEELCGDDKDEA